MIYLEREKDLRKLKMFRRKQRDSERARESVYDRKDLRH